MGELTAVEQEELSRWLAEDEQNRLWKEQLSNADYVSDLLESYRTYEKNVEASLQSFHIQHFGDRPERTIRGTVWMKRGWAAAAVLVPLIAASIWMAGKYLRRPVQTQNVAAVAPDIRPGRNAATLTLSNGNRILLDTGMSGQLLQKGGLRINYKEGKVAYQAGNPADADIAYNTLSTARGGEYQLVLPDGTKVWLNAASSLRYPTAFNANERRVELTGEAYFEVAGKKNQPFLVTVGAMNVRVLGTEFDIMAYPEEGRKATTLVQGAVKVENGNEAQRLEVGEQAIVTEDRALSVASHVNVESVIAWKSGFFQFSHMDIKTMMREIARWYDVEIVYQREDLSGEYGGRISRKLNLSELISLLEGNGVGHFKMEGRKLTVLP